jgi:hypothetical protein
MAATTKPSLNWTATVPNSLDIAQLFHVEQLAPSQP